MPTGQQIRAARALLDWSITELAKKVGLSDSGIQKIETGASAAPLETTVLKIVTAFAAAGVKFIDDKGVAINDDRVREIRDEEPFAKLLDELYYALKKNDEFLIAGARETLSTIAAHDAYKRIVKKGILYRKLIEEKDTYICGKLSWYRCVRTEHFQNAPVVIFEDKSAYLTEDAKKVIIIKDRAIAEANKNFFNMAWANSVQPTETISDIRYE